jgi:phospho-N-acetylmuramoyl-pentapeptide-transferase
MNTAAIAAIISFLIVAALGPVVIPFLIRLKVGQTEREELKSHLKKAGTPTMGGVMILAGVIVSSLIFAHSNPKVLPVLYLTVAFGLIGFLDDYLKVVLRRSDGLLPKQKMALQIVVMIIFAVYMVKFSGLSLAMKIPFMPNSQLDLKWFAIIIMFFAVIGTVNGVNFTDGVDGLAATVTVVVSLFLTIASVRTGAGIETITGAMCGALMGFLLYNCNPAKVFMGDTGSLALGGFVAAAAYMMQMPIFILIFGLIYLVEVLSVIIQVTYFKKTGGKRIFRMAPIHHHFELGGWSETKVVAVFSVITGVLCLIALLAM